MRLSNGTWIRAVPASESAVRGWRADTSIVDEALRIPDDLLEGVVLPTTSGMLGLRILLADTAGRALGVFFDLAKRGEAGAPGVRTVRAAWRSAPGCRRRTWSRCGR